MSICITQKSGTAVFVGKELGSVSLRTENSEWGGGQCADLTPAEARRVAQVLVRYAARAEDKNPGSKLGAAGGRAAAAKLTAEQRSERGRKAVQARWAKARGR